MRRLLTAPLLLLLCCFTVAPASALVNGLPLKGTPDLVRLEFEGGHSVCTGFFVDSQTILTAAHCLYSSEDGRRLSLDRIVAEDEKELKVKVISITPHPKYTRGGWSKNDIAVIQTKRNRRFQGTYRITPAEVPRKGWVRYYGAGRVDLTEGQKKYGRSIGVDSYLRIRSFLISFGKSKYDEKTLGSNTSIAPNDSGAPIIHLRNGRVIAIASKATVGMTYGSWIPAVSVGTVLTIPSNRNFLEAQGIEIGL